uniref:Uncharacterized protein n=1 Tax=Porcine reproductive and respiratory syndrome virus 2 TaxID=1965067 RepID=A0A515EIY6_9NIDO|nr:hypothetical protein [Porcine reproductive and respiratory syndrome virus 2]
MSQACIICALSATSSLVASASKSQSVPSIPVFPGPWRASNLGDASAPEIKTSISEGTAERRSTTPPSTGRATGCWLCSTASFSSTSLATFKFTGPRVKVRL